MILRLFLLLIFSATTLHSCRSEDPQALEQDLWDALMLKHDEVMPKMGNLSQTKSALNQYLEENPGLDISLREKIEKTVSDIGHAEDGMMDWMAQLIQPLESVREGRDHEAVMEYLEVEEEKVNVVADDMNSSLQAGQDILEGLSDASN